MENNNDEILTFVLKQIYGENNDSIGLIQKLKKDSNFLRLLNSLNIEYDNLSHYIKHIKEGFSMPINSTKEPYKTSNKKISKSSLRRVKNRKNIESIIQVAKDSENLTEYLIEYRKECRRR